MKEKFNRIVLDNPNLSSIVCFTKCISGQNLSLTEITKWFNMLVDKQDYRRADKKELLTWLSTQ